METCNTGYAQAKGQLAERLARFALEVDAYATHDTANLAAWKIGATDLLARYENQNIGVMALSRLVSERMTLTDMWQDRIAFEVLLHGLAKCHHAWHPSYASPNYSGIY